MDIGGQAVIEGVMMRGKSGYSTVVRRMDGSLTKTSQRYISYSKKYRILGFPVFRGAVALVESLVIGMKALSYSTDLAIEDEENKEAEEKNKNAKNKKSKEEKPKEAKAKNDSFLAKTIPIILAVIIGIGLFMALPYYIIGLIPVTRGSNPIIFNLSAGIIRIVFFLLYIYGISFLSDVRRLFEYHGAEHKTIACYEDGKELTAKNAREYSTLHPRCGTSFLIFAAVSCILVFAFIDAAISLYWTAYINPPWYLRLVVHIPLIPLVSGISYEFLKFTGKFRANFFIRILSIPGLGLQKITTREPDKDQIEVAIASLQEVLKIDKS